MLPKREAIPFWKEFESISEFIIEDYDVENPCFPAGICEGFHFLLNLRSNGKDVKLPNVEYETMFLPRLLRLLLTTHVTVTYVLLRHVKVDAKKM